MSDYSSADFHVKEFYGWTAMNTEKIYFIPGRGEKLDNFIGRTIIYCNRDVCGRELVPPFSKLRFGEQLKYVRRDLEREFPGGDGLLVGRSYGAYVLLHAISETGFDGRILLLSPVLGAASISNLRYGSIPPRAKRLLELAESGKFPAPGRMEIHTGGLDNGCSPELAEAFSKSVPGCELFIVDGAGHDLGEDYTREVLHKFLGICNDLERRPV
jgi:hypothetical protein